jgi:hypothetical protein
MEIGRQGSDFCHLNSDLWIAFAPSPIPVLLAPSRQLVVGFLIKNCKFSFTLGGME